MTTQNLNCIQTLTLGLYCDAILVAVKIFSSLMLVRIKLCGGCIAFSHTRLESICMFDQKGTGNKEIDTSGSDLFCQFIHSMTISKKPYLAAYVARPNMK